MTYIVGGKSVQDARLLKKLLGESTASPEWIAMFSEDSESRAADCGRDEGGKFGSGNKCAGDGGSQEVIRKVRDEGSRQTDVARKIYAMGTTERKLATLVEKLGGSPKESNVEPNLTRLSITVNDKDGNRLYHIDFQHSRARIYPLRKLTSDEAKQIKEVASELLPKEYKSKGTPFTVTVFEDPAELDKWEKENADRYQAIEDKYRFSLLLPPHQRPKKDKRSIDCRYASLLAFAQARNCGTGSGGFQKGNTCAGAVAADVAKGAAKGAVTGAAGAIGSLAPYPPYMAKGAAVGAAIGAVKGLYDNKMRPTRVMNKISEIGTTEKKVASLVRKLGGTDKSSADVRGKNLTIAVKNDSGKKIFHVEMNDKGVTIYPRRATGSLSTKEISRIKKIAKESVPKSVSVVVKSSSKSYLAKLVRSGFRVIADAAGTVIATSVLAPAADVAVGEAIYSVKKARKKG